MVGVSDKAKLFCHKCGKETMHETHWDGEDPDALLTVCKVCGTQRMRR